MEIHKFIVTSNGDISAGILSLYEEIEITCKYESGDEEEFREFMRCAIGEWFDGADVETSSEYKARIEQEARMFDFDLNEQQ